LCRLQILLMKLKTYIALFFIFTLCHLQAQDKLFFRNGKKSNCKVISVNLSTVDYKDSVKAPEVITVLKSGLLMAEVNGDIIIFGTEPYPNISSSDRKNPRISNKKSAVREKEQNFKNGIIGWQPVDIFWGRLTLSYERLFMDKRMGVAIPVSLSFDPRILIPGSSNDTVVNTATNQIRRNTGIIYGVDLNYYYETRSFSKFFFGPRFRYGTDVNLANVTAYTIQFQNGFLLCDSKGKMATTFAVGFGFARIVSTPFSSPFNPRQSYPWASFTLRLGFRK